MYYALAILAAFLLSAFQYLYKRKALDLFILRFLTYLSIFILLINPQITRKTEQVTRPVLYVLADNSQSVKKQGFDKKVRELVDKIVQSDLKDKFKLQSFQFSSALTPLDSLHFNGKQTDISQTLEDLKYLHQDDSDAAVILLSDGQSTLGQNYVYSLQATGKLHVYPVVLGDTMHYADVQIEMLNVNPYAYKNNRFPVEIFINGSVNAPVHTTLQIWEQSRLLYQKDIELSPAKPAVHLQTYLKTGKVGVHHYLARLKTLPNEKNTLNNKKYFSVEVIDNARKILLLASIIHPDIGAVKRSLTKNPYLKVDLKRPDENIKLSDYQAFIFYQPDASFQKIFSNLTEKQKNWLIITGKHTDWNFLNRQNLFFTKDFTASYENYFPYENKAFSLFHLPRINWDHYPPLQDHYGKIQFSKPVDIALYSRIKSIDTGEPLWAFNTETKQGVCLGENIWQWNMQAGLQKEQTAFDQFLRQVIQYISLSQKTDRLQISYQKQYFQGEPVKITARFLNENLEADTKVRPVVVLHTGKTGKIPMRLNADFYEVELPDLSPGTYSFTVQNQEGDLKKSGRFTVLNFNQEDKNLHANSLQLEQLAQQTGGKVYYPAGINTLINDLKQDKSYHALISYQTQKTGLIDYRLLLFLIVLLLALEWLLKKLRGEL